MKTPRRKFRNRWRPIKVVMPKKACLFFGLHDPNSGPGSDFCFNCYTYAT